MKNSIVSNVVEALEALRNLKKTLITFVKKSLTVSSTTKNLCYKCDLSCMNEDMLIKHKSLIHFKTYTEEELYVDDIDQLEDEMKCLICEKEFPWLAIS